MGSFSLLIHDEITADLLKLNAGDSEKLDLVQQISQPGYEVLNAMKSPRFIKTHFPISLLPPNLLDVGCKVSLQIFFGAKMFDSNTSCLSAEKKKTLQCLRHVKEFRFYSPPPTDGITSMLLVYFGQQRGKCVYQRT